MQVAEQVRRPRTAIRRSALSRPVALALDEGLLPAGSTFFDYGCGRGDDLQRLSALGYKADGWDPAYYSKVERRPADMVNLGYVVNVIEDPAERAEALRHAWSLARRVLIVAARLDWDSHTTNGRPYGDGILTAKHTFQKFFTQEELRAWIDGELGVRSLAAAPGIFYVFRDDAKAQAFLAGRVRFRPASPRQPRISESLYEANRNLLEPLISFIEYRGRPPHVSELPEAGDIVDRFGSVKSAVSLIKRVVGDTNWQAAREVASNDLTVFLALAAFRGRPKFTELPPDLQLDVKYFFGSYRTACSSADALLFGAGNQAAIDRACRESTIGKLTPEALYVHITSLPKLTPLLRVYEGCGRALVGTADANIIKLNRIEPKVSYLSYPAFDRDAHPALAASIRANLKRLHIKFQDFRNSNNPPIIHRKETFVAADYPGRDKFARLTAQEEKHGLYSSPSTIGTRDKWGDLLEAKGLRLRGHRLMRSHAQEPSQDHQQEVESDDTD